MGAAATLPLAIGGSVFGAATSVLGAQSQNDAARKSMRSVNRALTTQTQQTQASAALERAKRINEARRIRGRLTVAAGDMGTTIASLGNLDRQIDADSLLDQAIISTNERNQIAAIRSAAQAQMVELAARQRNLVLSGLSGALQGASTGLSIGGGIESLTAQPPINTESALSVGRGLAARTMPGGFFIP